MADTFNPRGAPVPSTGYYDGWELTNRPAMLPFLAEYTNRNTGEKSGGFAMPSMVTEPVNALVSLLNTPAGTMPNPQSPENQRNALTALLSLYGGNALGGMARGAAGRAAGHALEMEAARPVAYSNAIEGAMNNPSLLRLMDDINYAGLNRRALDDYGVGYEGLSSSQEAKLRGWSDPALLSDTGKPNPVGAGVAGNVENMRVYHGTDTPFSSANTDSMWVTTRPEIASNYANGLHRGNGYEASSPSIMPLDLSGKMYDATALQNRTGLFDEARANAREAGADFIKYPGGNYEAINRGTVRSPLTGELLFSDTGKPNPVGAGVAGHLPMDEASRMARAREMGFNTDQVLYHGTGKDFEQFNPGERANGSKRLTYLTDNPDIADIYANSQNYGLKGGGNPMIYPVFAKAEKPLVVSDKGPDGSFGWVSDNLAAALGVEHPPAGKYSTLYDEARRQGYDQVQIREMTDLGGQQTQYIPLDPSNIRSVNAAFDPAKADSSFLLASDTGRPNPLGAALTSDNQENSLMDLLKKYGIR